MANLLVAAVVDCPTKTDDGQTGNRGRVVRDDADVDDGKGCRLSGGLWL